jgi:hypothetical protein
MSGPDWVLLFAGSYLAIGFLFGLAFVAVGVNRIDPAARGTSIVFRALILPGSVAFWPALAVTWVLRREERS